MLTSETFRTYHKELINVIRNYDNINDYTSSMVIRNVRLHINITLPLFNLLKVREMKITKYL